MVHVAWQPQKLLHKLVPYGTFSVCYLTCFAISFNFDTVWGLLNPILHVLRFDFLWDSSEIVVANLSGTPAQVGSPCQWGCTVSVRQWWAVRPMSCTNNTKGCISPDVRYTDARGSETNRQVSAISQSQWSGALLLSDTQPTVRHTSMKNTISHSKPPCSLQMLYVGHVCFVDDYPKRRWQASAISFARECTCCN